MAANGDVTLTGNDWTQIADGGLTAASWQNKGGQDVYIAATAADTAPTGEPGGWPVYGPRQGEVGIDATAMFAGVSGAAYLWAYVRGTSGGTLWRSHG